jgi:hypothetical protein
MKILQNFIKKIKKLKNYYVLSENEDFLLLGTQVFIQRKIDISANIFQPYSTVVNIKPHIILILALNDNSSELKFYKDLDIPIYIFPKNILSLNGLTEEEIEGYIDKFVETYILK